MANLADVVIDYLVAQGVATAAATDIFNNILPDGAPDTALCVIETSGLQPSRYLPTKEPTFQVFLRASDYLTGRTKFDAVRTALHQKMGLTMGSIFFFFIHAVTEGGYTGKDDRGRDTFSINFQCRTRPA